MSRTVQPRSRVLLTAAAVVALLAALVPAALPAGATSPATFTTVSTTDGDVADLCANGNPGVNCNMYFSKDYVWLNGGPAGAALPDGTYFFAIGEPGFQADVEGPKLLSTDTKADRTFTVAAGVITYNSMGGAHDTDGDLVRAMDYGDTSNSGGVYIAAICDATADPVRPSDCKFDAFKVVEAPPPPNVVNAIFQGTKFLDANANGMWDDGEEPIEGWGINIYKVEGANRTLLKEDELDDSTTYTDVDGNFFFESEDVLEDSAEQFIVCEEPQTGWRQTGPVSIEDPDDEIEDAFELAAGSAANGAAVAPGGTGDEMCYDVTTDGSAIATASLLDFFNIPEPALSGAKYFDADESGHRNTEDGIEGWPIVIADTDGVVCELLTDADGNWSSDDCTDPLMPGTYDVYEVQATNTDIWTQTGNVGTDGEQWTADGDGTSVSLLDFVYTVTMPGDVVSSVTDLLFGNVCVLRDTPGGRTIGFWGNKNGQALINGTDTAALSALNLKYSNGNAFDPGTKGAVKTFLQNATSNGTGVHMLSAQLAATVLNTMNAHGGLDPITDPAFVLQWTVDGVTTTQSIADWIADADAYLLAGDFSDKSITTEYKDLFDAINNQQSFVVGDGSPATCEAPVFPTAE